MKGIDVSTRQGNIDWQRVADDGIDFAMIKATQGRGEEPATRHLRWFQDSRFAQNIAAASATGIQCGVYHYFTAQNAAEAIEEMAADLLNGRREKATSVRDEILHTVACKAAIKAGWKNDEAELLALVKQVMSREDLKYCPHGRPICVSLSKKQLEKQFKRT